MAFQPTVNNISTSKNQRDSVIESKDAELLFSVKPANRNGQDQDKVVTKQDNGKTTGSNSSDSESAQERIATRRAAQNNPATKFTPSKETLERLNKRVQKPINKIDVVTDTNSEPKKPVRKTAPSLSSGREKPQLDISDDDIRSLTNTINVNTNTNESRQNLRNERKPMGLESRIVSHGSKFRFMVTDLPSKFYPYPEHSRVIVDSYTYREIEVLSDSSLPLDMDYEFVLEGVETQGFDKYDLTYFDFQYTNLLRKLRSIENPQFMTPYYCERCNTSNKKIFSLINIGFDDLKIELIPNLPVNIDFNSIGRRRFMPLTIGKFIELYRKDLVYLKRKGDYVLNRLGEKVYDTSAQIAGMCIDYDDVETAYYEFSQIRDRDDWQLINEIDKLFDHGISAFVFNCENRIGEDPNKELTEIKEGKELRYVRVKDERQVCNNKISIELLGGEALLLPFHEHEGDIRDRISFG